MKIIISVLTITVLLGGIKLEPIEIGNSACAQVLTIEQIKTNLLNNPPNTGDATLREQSLLALDEILLDDSSRTAQSIFNFYSAMMEKVKDELKETMSKGAAVWMMYNHGFIVKTPQVVFAFDLVNGYSGWSTQLPAELLKQIMVLFVSHRHGDHYDSTVANAVLANGGYVVVPSEDSNNGNIPMTAGESLTLLGLHIKAHGGLHSVPVRIFEVTCPNGLKFLHTGDNQTSETLPQIDSVDVLLLNAWVNESGAATAVVGMRNSINKLKPKIMIPGHIQELYHDPSSRALYRWAFEVDDVSIPSEVQVMAWGERYFVSKEIEPKDEYPNKALRLKTGGDYVEVPHADVLSPAQVTMECWINLDGKVGEQCIVDKRDANGGYNLRVAGDNYPLGVAVVIKETSETILWVGDILQPYTWYHLAATYDGAMIKLYLNGELVGSWSETLNMTNTLSPLRIGEYNSYPSGSVVFHGLIDDLRIWNKARTPAEIKSTMKMFLGGDEPGLIGYWKFDEATGTAINDASHYQNHGVLKGMAKNVPSTAPLGYEAQNRAVRLDQQGALVEVPHADELSPVQITLECWLKKSSTLDYEYTIVDKRGNGSGYNLRLAGSAFPLGVFIVFDGNGKSIITGSGEHINSNIWYHIAASYDGSMVKLYLDGELIASQNTTVDISQSIALLRIGEFLGYPGNSLGLSGDLDELRIWNVARSQQEIQSTMHKNLSGMEPGLVGYWRFNEAGGSIAYDKTAYENNGVLSSIANFVSSNAPIGFTPPPYPVGFRAIGMNNQVTLHWKTIDNSDINHYVIYSSANSNFEPTPADAIATVAYPGTTYDDVAVSNGERRFYRIKAVDNQGHYSQPSLEIVGKPAEIYSDYFTGVYYYPWYSNTWGHHWSGEFVRDYLDPPQAPMLGQYDCRDRSVIRQHLDWSKQYGIDLWVCSWWGINSNEDITIKNYIKPELTSGDVKFAIFYESFILGQPPWVIDSNVETKLKNDYTYIANTYFSHPNYYRIDNRPVVFIYVSGLYQGDYVNAFTNVRQAVSALGYDLYLIGDEMNFGPPSDHMKFLDSVTSYIILGAQGYGIDKDFFGPLGIKFNDWEIAANARGLKIVPVAVPGFNNRKLGATLPNNSIVIPRRSTQGATQTSYFEEYIKIGRPFVDPDLKLMMITSWNEWHEDTQIEPINTAAPTNHDKSSSGTEYTNGYYYEGYGMKFLEVARNLLASGLTDVGELSGAIPTEFVLFQNYPNPFNPSTTIKYEIPRKSFISLKIYDLLGREIAILVNNEQIAGKYEIQWNAERLASGVYFYILRVGDPSTSSIQSFMETKKLILLR